MLVAPAGLTQDHQREVTPCGDVWGRAGGRGSTCLKCRKFILQGFTLVGVCCVLTALPVTVRPFVLTVLSVIRLILLVW